MLNPSKIFPKFFQNPFKIRQKSIPKSFKIDPTSLPKSKKNPNALPKRPERDFFDFLLIFGGLGTSQNGIKTAKIRKKMQKNRRSKKTCFRTRFFIDFSRIWPVKIYPKSMIFRTFFKNVNFAKICKNHRKTCVFHWFFMFPASRNLFKIDAKTPSKRKS